MIRYDMIRITVIKHYMVGDDVIRCQVITHDVITTHVILIILSIKNAWYILNDPLAL